MVTCFEIDICSKTIWLPGRQSFTEHISIQC